MVLDMTQPCLNAVATVVKEQDITIIILGTSQDPFNTSSAEVQR